MENLLLILDLSLQITTTLTVVIILKEELDKIKTYKFLSRHRFIHHFELSMIKR